VLLTLEASTDDLLTGVCVRLPCTAARAQQHGGRHWRSEPAHGRAPRVRRALAASPHVHRCSRAGVIYPAASPLHASFLHATTTRN
jgi:hypothetical protein